jgi:hypothetical protein
VEQESQVLALQRLGCGYAQGYLWSRPAPIDQVTQLDLTPYQAQDGLPSPAVLERVRALLAEGASSLSIAAALNADGVRTPDGRRWHARSVETLRQSLGD